MKKLTGGEVGISIEIVSHIHRTLSLGKGLVMILNRLNDENGYKGLDILVIRCILELHQP